MADLVVVVPSRGRPGSVVNLVDACEQTCTAETRLVVAVDCDDPELDTYKAALADRPQVTVHTVVEPAGHVGAINAGADLALGWHPFAVAKLDDDHRPRTTGWDTAYLDALRELGTGVVYGNDLLQGANLPTAPALTADIVHTLGWMGPPVLTHLYVDNFWLDLGRELGRIRYLPGVIVEHLHPIAGKAAMDDGYRRANSPQRYATDGAAYDTYRSGQFRADLAKVRALL